MMRQSFKALGKRATFRNRAGRVGNVQAERLNPLDPEPSCRALNPRRDPMHVWGRSSWPSISQLPGDQPRRHSRLETSTGGAAKLGRPERKANGIGRGRRAMLAQGMADCRGLSPTGRRAMATGGSKASVRPSGLALTRQNRRVSRAMPARLRDSPKRQV